MTSRPSRWPPGARVLLRETIDGATWCARPVTVVHDDGRRVGLRLTAGTQWLAAHGPAGHRAHTWQRPWHLAPVEWTGTDATFLIDSGRSYGLVLFTAPGSTEPVKWYVNFQDPLRRRPWGFDTLDRELDMELLPGAGRPVWKDREKFGELVRRGFVSTVRARALMREARAARQAVTSPEERATLLGWAATACPAPDLWQVLTTRPVPEDLRRELRAFHDHGTRQHATRPYTPTDAVRAAAGDAVPA
ncbi:hypothetical protein [Streptomyces sp. NPDC006739]|uniref:hypothetical protein n=1 Tax=Streptomyces sp. NPDC006739 TaxID=3364763 RepID=UPI00369AC0A2